MRGATHKNRERTQRRQKFYCDKQAHSLPTLEKGENVRIRDKKKWKPAIVLRSSSEPRSYVYKLQKEEDIEGIEAIC